MACLSIGIVLPLLTLLSRNWTYSIPGKDGSSRLNKKISLIFTRIGGPVPRSPSRNDYHITGTDSTIDSYLNIYHNSQRSSPLPGSDPLRGELVSPPGRNQGLVLARRGLSPN